jgi:hypothetical protein
MYHNFINSSLKPWNLWIFLVSSQKFV